MLHHEVVDFLGIFVPPFLLIVGVVVLPLPFCCLDKVGRILWVIREVMVGSLSSQITNAASGPSNFRWVCDVLGYGFKDMIGGGRHLGSPRVVENNVFEALHGCCK
jgi:hypothetical protein